MANSSRPLAPGDDAPIDAEFEPALPKAKSATRASGGPGWVAFGLVSLIAFSGLALAAIAAGLVPFYKPGSSEIATLEAQIAALEQADSAGETQAASLSSDLTALSTRADRLAADNRQADQTLETLRAEIDAIQVDISALQRARVASLADGTDRQPSADPAPDVAALNARIAAAEQALVVQLDAYTSDIESLKLRITALEDRAGSDALNAASSTNSRTEAALALSAIEAAARRGRPFLTAYQRLETAMPGNDAVARLSPIASKAVPTLSDLRATYPALMDRALDLDAETTPGNSGWMRNLFGDGIQVRRSDAVTARDHLNRALAALEAGELAETIEHIQAIDSNLQPVFTDWLQNAEDRHQLEETLEALRLAMIAEERP